MKTGLENLQAALTLDGCGGAVAKLLLQNLGESGDTS